MGRVGASLPIHRKLVALALALAVTAAAVVLVILGGVVVDLWRYRRAISANTGTLARILAQNTTSSVQFLDPVAALPPPGMALE